MAHLRALSGLAFHPIASFEIEISENSHFDNFWVPSFRVFWHSVSKSEQKK
jgi:hypothetical protein